MARILIVDDDKDILKFIDAVLSQAKYEVRAATDPIKAIEMLNSGHWDLLITDANMPQYTGFELIKSVRSNPQTKNLPIAMLTGLREKSSLEKAIQVGVDDYIVKPIEPMTFLKKVDDLLAKRPPQQKPQLELSEVATGRKSLMSLPTELISVSDVGITLAHPFPLPEGTLIHLNSEIFKKIGIEPPPVRVLQISKLDDGTFKLLLGYVSIANDALEKIKVWIYSESKKRERLAS